MSTKLQRFELGRWQKFPGSATVLIENSARIVCGAIEGNMLCIYAVIVEGMTKMMRSFYIHETGGTLNDTEIAYVISYQTPDGKIFHIFDCGYPPPPPPTN